MNEWLTEEKVAVGRGLEEFWSVRASAFGCILMPWWKIYLEQLAVATGLDEMERGNVNGSGWLREE